MAYEGAGTEHPDNVTVPGGSPGADAPEHGGDQPGGAGDEPAPRERSVSRIEGHLHGLRRRLARAEAEAREANARADRIEREREAASITERLDGAASLLDTKLAEAKARLKKAATDDLDADAYAQAQQEMAELAIERARLRAYRETLKADGGGAPEQQQARAAGPAAPAYEPSVQEWWEDNSDWLAMEPPAGAQDHRKPYQREMTRAAMEIDTQLKSEGRLGPHTRAFFDELSRRMERRFPTYFGGTAQGGDGSVEVDLSQQAAPTPKPTAPTLAPARAGGAPAATGKVRLTAAQLNVARRMGLDPAQYAKYLPKG